MTAGSFALGFAAARGVGHRFYPADDVQDTKLTFHRIFGNFHGGRRRRAGISFSRSIWFFCKKNVGVSLPPDDGLTLSEQQRRSAFGQTRDQEHCQAAKPWLSRFLELLPLPFRRRLGYQSQTRLAPRH